MATKKGKCFIFTSKEILFAPMDYACASGKVHHTYLTLNGLVLFLNLGFPFGEILRRNKCTKWRNMGKCFHPREDIKASKRIRALNSLFVSQIIHKVDNSGPRKF